MPRPATQLKFWIEHWEINGDLNERQEHMVCVCVCVRADVHAPTEESAVFAAVLCFQVISITKSGSVGVKFEIGLPAARLNY